MEALQRLHNRGSISTGYDIENSLKLEDANFEHITKNYSGDGDMRTWTYSTWVKKCKFGSSNFDYMYMFAGQNTSIHFLNNGILRVALYNGSSTVYADIDRLFRDGSAWYHIIVALDTTQSTAADRVKIYINGVRETVFDNSTYTSMSQNEEFTIGQASANYQVGYFYAGGGSNYGFSGYMAETHYVNGTALDQDSFGEFDSDSGIWIPKEYTGSHGSKGFYLKFDDSSNLGKDSSSGGIGDFSLSNITAADQATDTPTNNFCTLNPLYNYAYGNTITEGATKIYGAANNWGGGKATFGLTSGKWYWEIKQLAGANTFMGLQTDGEDNISSGNAQSQNTSVVFYTDGTLQYSNGSETSTSAPNSITANSIVGFALDLDSPTQTIKVYLNGSLITTFGSSGTANLSTYNLADKTVFPFVALYDRTVNMNFGGYTISSISSAASDENGYGTFEYAPPSGYYALCTKNLEEFG